MKKSSASYRGAVAIVYLCMFFEGGSNILLSATKEPLMQHFGVGLVEISLLFTIRSIFCGVIPMLCGGLSDRFGRKRIILVGAVFFLAYYALVPNLTVFTPMLVLIALLGVGYSFMDPSAQAILFDNYPNPTPYMPFIQVAFALGSILSPLLVSLVLSQGLSWTVAYYIYLALGVLITAYVALQKFPPTARKLEKDSAENGKLTGYYHFATEPKPLREGLIAFLYVLCLNMTSSVINNWADVYMRDIFAYTEVKAVQVLSYYQIGCMLGAVAASFIARRMHTTNMLSLFPIGGFAFFGLALLMPGGGWFTAMLICSALFTGSLFSLTVGYVGQLFWRSAGASTGAISSASAVGIALSSLLAGQLIPSLGVRGVFAIMAIASASAVVLGITLKVRHNKLLGLVKQPK